MFAFSGCKNLSSINIPNKVTSIGYAAFYGCSSLQSVTIPSKVTSIDRCAFSACPKLKSFTVDSNNTMFQSSTDGAILFSNNYKTLVTYPSAFGNVTIPESVTTIGADAFEECNTLTKIIIPEGVTTIGKEAFYNCPRLDDVTIPKSMTRIEPYAFDTCPNIYNITFLDTKVIEPTDPEPEVPTTTQVTKT